jgi:hypothetical protein
MTFRPDTNISLLPQITNPFESETVFIVQDNAVNQSQGKSIWHIF